MADKIKPEELCNLLNALATELYPKLMLDFKPHPRLGIVVAYIDITDTLAFDCPEIDRMSQNKDKSLTSQMLPVFKKRVNQVLARLAKFVSDTEIK